MTQEAHTPEPWLYTPAGKHMAENYSQGHAIVRADISTCQLVAGCFSDVSGGDEQGKANARRIVACVNALAGIPIEAIESGVVAEALLAVVNATRAYLPPDGISEQECINRILEATDNPKINPVIAAWETSK